MEYCCHLWDGATGTERLDKIQKRCCSYMGHRENTIASMNIQSLQHRRRVADLTIYYKMVSKLAPQAVCELLPEIDLRRTTVRTDAQQLRTAVQKVLESPTRFLSSRPASGSQQSDYVQEDDKQNGPDQPPNHQVQDARVIFIFTHTPLTP
eukprot:GHVN01030913.1.p1 GENE.GHVN01030913.1~~GHVN01030913.1.p1  ORF type:complete len:151 (-),score=12.86 GHVN01030913.1:195-647(-)